MSRGARIQLAKTKDLKKPTEYVLALAEELKGLAFDEEDSLAFKGQWRRQAFGVDESVPLDLEIGTGNGFYFGHRALKHPERCLVGIELKYKPMVQAIRRVVRGGGNNARILRYNAAVADHLFAENELNDVIIHFPDPWEKLRWQKHRLIQDDFLKRLYLLQKPGSRLEFKTDSRDYFLWAMERFERGPYEITGHSEDLHHSPFAEQNFVTHFESIFLRKGLPIHYCEMRKPAN
jgi:tRNA (guanine-N7-)-methyltransferase